MMARAPPLGRRTVGAVRDVEPADDGFEDIDAFWDADDGGGTVARRAADDDDALLIEGDESPPSSAAPSPVPSPGAPLLLAQGRASSPASTSSKQRARDSPSPPQSSRSPRRSPPRGSPASSGRSSPPARSSSGSARASLLPSIGEADEPNDDEHSSVLDDDCDTSTVRDDASVRDDAPAHHGYDAGNGRVDELQSPRQASPQSPLQASPAPADLPPDDDDDRPPPERFDDDDEPPPQRFDDDASAARGDANDMEYSVSPSATSAPPFEPRGEPPDDDASVARSEPPEDDASVARSEPREDDASVARSEPREDDASVARSEPPEDDASVARSEPREDDASVARSEPPEDDTSVARSEPREEDEDEAPPPPRTPRSARSSVGSAQATPRVTVREAVHRPTPFEDREELDDDEDGLRRSRRRKFPPMKFWKNERIIYKHDVETAAQNIVAIQLGAPTPKPKHRAKRARDAGGGGGRASSRTPETPVAADLEGGDTAELWDEASQTVAARTAIVRAESLVSTELPVSRHRSKRRTAGDVGLAAQAFNIQQVDVGGAASPPWISGHIILPPGAVKDDETSGRCAQVFFVAAAARRALELAYGLPDDGGAAAAFDDATATRFRLCAGDQFHVPPNNSYRLENHSASTPAKIFWCIIKPVAD